MKIKNIKIEGYIFVKDPYEDIWICKNHNLMSGDIKLINEIMPKLKHIEALFDNHKKG